MKTLCSLLALSALAHAGGNVTASIDAAGNLVILGDDLANDIDLHHERGYLAVDGYSTKVNGSLGPWAVPQSWTGELYVDLGAGDDTFLLTTSLPAAGTYVAMGDGSDWLAFYDYGASGPVHFDLGAGNDQLRLADMAFRGYTYLDMGEGQDAVDVSCGSFREQAIIRGGPGMDHIRFEPCAELTPVWIVGFKTPLR